MYVKRWVFAVIVTQHFRLRRMKMSTSEVYLSGYTLHGISGQIMKF